MLLLPQNINRLCSGVLNAAYTSISYFYILISFAGELVEEQRPSAFEIRWMNSIMRGSLNKQIVVANKQRRSNHNPDELVQKWEFLKKKTNAITGDVARC